MARYSKSKDLDAPDNSYPPLIGDYLAEEIMRIREVMSQKRMTWPEEIPTVPALAAEWWIARQKPASRYGEDCHQVTVIGGSNRWECPYHLRLAASLRIYVTLPEVHRDLILAALDDGVWWNGDEVMEKDGQPGIFIRICDETGKMQKNPQEYIKRARSMARAVIQQ